MKTLIAVLTVASFIQSAILPIDLVLIILICRSYIRSDKNNLWLAFAYGLFNAHLNLAALGLLSCVYLFIIALTETLSKSRLAGNSLLIIPLSLVMMSINQAVPSLFIGYSPQLFPKVVLESFLSLPILFLVRVWEERFIVRKGIKLRV